MTFLRRFLAGLTHSGPGYEPAFRPARGDDVEAWLRGHRDAHTDEYDSPSPEWYALDQVLNDYGHRADTGAPLTEHTCDCGDVPF